jgi:hypothetical protein
MRTAVSGTELEHVMGRRQLSSDTPSPALIAKAFGIAKSLTHTIKQLKRLRTLLRKLGREHERWGWRSQFKEHVREVSPSQHYFREGLASSFVILTSFVLFLIFCLVRLGMLSGGFKYVRVWSSHCDPDIGMSTTGEGCCGSTLHTGSANREAERGGSQGVVPILRFSPKRSISLLIIYYFSFDEISLAKDTSRWMQRCRLERTSSRCSPVELIPCLMMTSDVMCDADIGGGWLGDGRLGV